jgi:hypothetical protein
VTPASLSPKRRPVKNPGLILFVLLAACHGEKPPSPTETNVGPPPPQVCAEIRKGVAALDKLPTVHYDDKGEATVEQDTWMTMTPDNHADLARTLAFAAACASGHQSDAQSVRIRNELGTILLETTISTKVDLKSFRKQ